MTLDVYEQRGEIHKNGDIYFAFSAKLFKNCTYKNDGEGFVSSDFNPADIPEDYIKAKDSETEEIFWYRPNVVYSMSLNGKNWDSDVWSTGEIKLIKEYVLGFTFCHPHITGKLRLRINTEDEWVLEVLGTNCVISEDLMIQMTPQHINDMIEIINDFA